jgi:hypothetical protein
MLSAVAKRLEAQELIARAALALVAMAPVAAAAQTPPPPAAAIAADPLVRARATALIPVLAGKPGYDALFAPSFQQAVPQPRFAALAETMRTSLGMPRTVERFEPIGRWGATIVIGYDRGTATIRLMLQPAAPHAVTGLLVTGTTLRGDTAAAVQADVAALPGAAQLGVYALDGSAPTAVFEVDGARPAPLGSAFKLWVLAEAARQVAAGERRWDDVVPVGTPSLPSGILQGWPAATPVTIQTLATLMISISDNTATDTLLTLLGRAKVDAMAARFGGRGPVLTTREAFVIKSDPALIAAWAKGDAEQRRALLSAQAQRIATAPIDPMMFSGGPLANDSVEWFAAPRDMARLLATLRDAGPVVRGILSVNRGVDPMTAARFDYVGFKGGSEPGVIALDALAQAKTGRWYVVSGSWHRTDAAVDEATFLPLVTRALALVAQ